MNPMDRLFKKVQSAPLKPFQNNKENKWTKYDKSGGSFRQGNETEEKFQKLIKEKYPNAQIQQSSEYDDRVKHIDFYITDNNQKYSVEVKSMKRISRADLKPQSEWIPAEFKSVGGHPGWMYGTADKLAFETGYGFLIVNRQDFTNLAEKLIDQKSKVQSSDQAKYKVYSRVFRDEQGNLINRNDLLGWIKTSDVEKLPHIRIIGS